MACIWEGKESIKKSIFTEFTSSENNVQHVYCLHVCYAHSQHIESHLSRKQPQAKILIAFLFSQLHFNNVTFMAAILLWAVRDVHCVTRESP